MNMSKITLLALCLAFAAGLSSNAISEENPAQSKPKTKLMPLKNNGKYWPESTRFLVIVHQYDGDVEWAKKLKFPHVIYEKEKPEKEPFSAINKAKGETNLLKFIAEFYDDLPENIIQVYQYEYKDYHEGSLVDILNSPEFELQYAESKTRGFWNFNHWVWEEEPPIDGMLESGFWPDTMAKTFGSIYDYGNFLYGKKACAQFVVSRDRIRTLPREFYSDLYFWLVNNTKGEINTGFDPVTKTRLPTPLDWDVNSNYFTSRCMEKTWELIFTTKKTHEDISVPIFVTKNGPQGTKKSIAYLSAVYGAKKYYRDITSEIIYRFIRDNKIIIPASANFNEFFTDVVADLKKTLKIKINDMEYRIPEIRTQDIIINLSHA